MAAYESLPPHLRAEMEKPRAAVMCAGDAFYAECNVPGCSGVQNFPWCTRTTRSVEEAELWGQEHVYERHWQPVRQR